MVRQRQADLLLIAVDGAALGEATFWLGADLPTGYHHVVAKAVDGEHRASLIVTPSFVISGAPNFLPSTTLRPLGPRVILTVSAS